MFIASNLRHPFVITNSAYGTESLNRELNVWLPRHAVVELAAPVFQPCWRMRHKAAAVRQPRFQFFDSCQKVAGLSSHVTVPALMLRIFPIPPLGHVLIRCRLIRVVGLASRVSVHRGRMLGTP